MGFVTETQLRAMLAKGIPNPYPLGDEERLTPAAADFLKSRGIRLARGNKDSRSTGGSRSSESSGISGVPGSSSGSAEQHLPLIPVGVSNRHVHLSQEHVERLFGAGHKLTIDRALSQEGQYAAAEKVTLRGPKGELHNVRVLGPAREHSQVEISRSDSFQLGIQTPLRLSGDIAQSPGVMLLGPADTLWLERGLIIAKRHVHMSPADAKLFQVQQGDRIQLRTIADASNGRSLVFPDVIVRVDSRYRLDYHIDLDEANAAFLSTGDVVEWCS
ncbi:phosphate propanoyltransferase [Paenibacillus marinisediminis]